MVLALSPVDNTAANANIKNAIGMNLLFIFDNKFPKIKNINPHKNAPEIGSSLKKLTFYFQLAWFC